MANCPTQQPSISNDNCSASSGLPVGTDSGLALSCNASTFDKILNSNDEFVTTRTGKRLKTLGSSGLSFVDNIANLDAYKNSGNTWDDALECALQNAWGVLFPKNGTVTLTKFTQIQESHRCRLFILNGCRIEVNSDIEFSCSHFDIKGRGTIFLATTVVTARKGRMTCTSAVKNFNVYGGVDFEGDLKIAQLAQNMVGPTNVMTLKPGHNFQVGRHCSSSWNNNLLPNSPSLIPAPNKGDENFLNRATQINGDTVTLSYNIAAYTIPANAYVFQNTRFDRDFIRILGDGEYRFEDVTFNYSPSYMISVRDDTQKARVFFDNVQGYNYAIDGFVMKCHTWIAENCKFGQQYDVAKSLSVVQMPKDGTLRWTSVDSRRGNGDGEIFVFGVQTFPNIELIDCYFDGKNGQPIPYGVYNSPAPTNGNAIGIYDCLHPFVTSSDGVVEEEYDGGAFSARGCQFIKYKRAIFSTTFVQRKKFSFVSCNIDDCYMDCTPTYFNIELLDQSSIGPVNVSNCKVNCTTYSLNAIHPIIVNYNNCDFRVDNSDPSVVTSGAPARLENLNMNNCSLRGWWTVLDNANVRLRDVALYPKEGNNETTLSIADPFFDKKQNNLILRGWNADTSNSFADMKNYFGGNATGSNFSPNSPFAVPFRIEGVNLDYTYGNEFFAAAQAGVGAGTESYKTTLYRERDTYPPLPSKGLTSLYVPIHSYVESNIDGTRKRVVNRARALVTANAAKDTNYVSLTLQKQNVASLIKTGDYIGIYYATFKNAYWYRITSITSQVGDSITVGIDRFPISGSTANGLFQDITTNDEAYWIKLEPDAVEPGTDIKGCVVESTAGQTVNGASYRLPTFNTVVYDDLSFFSNTNATRLTIPNGVSRVDVYGFIDFPSESISTDGWFQLNIIQRDAAGTRVRIVADSGAYKAGTTSQEPSISAQGIPVNVGDYFELRFRGTPFGVNTQSYSVARLEIRKVK